VDLVAEFFIAALAFHEGKEAWEGELVEGDDEDDDPSNPHIPIRGGFNSPPGAAGGRR
jgi:hypothetical protein